MNILLIDDDKLVLESLKEILESEGHNVYSALSGHDAIELLSVYKVDLIFTDIVMPGIKGEEIIIRLRHSKIPIVSISGLSKKDVISRLIESLGVKGFLQKPFKAEACLKLIRNLNKEALT